MKFRNIFALTAVFASLFGVNAFADTVISCPIDSRPVSNEYLADLIEENGDTFISVDEKYLDKFYGSGENGSFADSEAVRDEILKAVKENNREDTTVIINSSSYFTGGLIGSRRSENYMDTQKAIDHMFNLIDTYKNPTYYVNAVMPRNLPESRGGAYWPDEEKIKGISWFYLKYNDDETAEKYSLVTPSQFLMEYGYVMGKKTELGTKGLSKWEQEFLNYVDENYMKNSNYRPYIENYKSIFDNASLLLETFIRWQRAGRIEEVIIGNDDLQLPESISYFAQKGENWVQSENGSPIKYSFSRTAMKYGQDSAEGRVKKAYGSEELEKALKGESQNINFLYGMDEIPQMIYARSVAKRNGKSANIIMHTPKGGVTGEFDIVTPEKLSKYYASFISAGLPKTAETIDIFVYDYEKGSKEAANKTENEIYSLIKENKKTGLIELYNNEALYGENYLFDSILENTVKNKDGCKFSDMSVFCAWNTNANAIGIGLSMAQIDILADKTEIHAQKSTENLIRHIIEDGIYFADVRQTLTKENYQPKEGENITSRLLIEKAGAKKIPPLFEGRIYDGYKIENIEVTNMSFPWLRLFDCYVDVSSEAKEAI